MGNKTWLQVAGILTLILVSGGIITYTDLFGALFNLKGTEYTYTGDINCSTECESYINVTTSYWEVCFAGYDGTKYENETLFKKVSRSRKLHVNIDKVENIISTDIPVEVDWLVPTRGAGNWRPIQDGDCWERGKVNKIKLVAHKEPWQTVKWTFRTGDYVDIDPLWQGEPKKFQKEVYVDTDDAGLQNYKTEYFWLYENSEVKLEVPDSPTCLWDNKKDMRDCYMDISVEYKIADRKYLKDVNPKLLMKEGKEKNFETSLKVGNKERKVFQNPNNYTMRYEFEYPPYEGEKFDIELFNITIDPVVSACSTLTSSGVYTMTGNITMTASNCITLQDALTDVLFDCQGNSFLGNAAYDYAIFGDYTTEDDFANITVQNCDFDYIDSYVISFRDLGTVAIYNTTATRIQDSFIALTNSDNNIIDNLVGDIEDYGDGIYGVYYSSSSNGVHSNFYINESASGYYFSGNTLEIYNMTFDNLEYVPVDLYSSGLTVVENVSARAFSSLPYEPVVNYYEVDDVLIENWNNNFSQILLQRSTNATLRNVVRYGSDNSSTTRNMGSIAGYVDISAGTIYTTFDNVTLYDTYDGFYLSYFLVNMTNCAVYSPGDTPLYLQNTEDGSIVQNSIFEGGRWSSSPVAEFGGVADNGTLRNNKFYTFPSQSSQYGLLLPTGYTNWQIYNNLFNHTASQSDWIRDDSTSNVYFVTPQAGDRIWQGNETAPTIGGNAYINADGTGYSQTCTDGDVNGFCDTPYTTTNVVDTYTYSSKYFPNTPPYWSDNSSNNTLNGKTGETVTFAVRWREPTEDVSNLSTCTFEWFNGSNWNKEDQSIDRETGTQNFEGQEAAPTPAVIVEDDFTEASNTLLKNHVPTPTGTAWTLDSSTGIAEGNVLSTNQLSFIQDYNDYGINLVTPAPEVADYNVSVDVTTAATSDDRAILFARYTDDNNNYHFGFTTSATECRLWKVVSGTRTQIAYTGLQGIVNGDTVTLEVDGTSINVYRNGVSLLSATDSSLTAAGQGGIGCGDYKGDGGEDCRNTWRLDNFIISQTPQAGADDVNANKTAVEYTDTPTDIYTDIATIDVTVDVSLYSAAGSTNNGNTPPTLWLLASDDGGLTYDDIGNMSVTSTGNFTTAITGSSYLTAWSDETQRNFSIQARYMDYNSSGSDNISWDGVWLDFNTSQEFLNVTQNFSDTCGGNQTDCWCNNTFTVSTNNGDTIKWKQYAEDSFTAENETVLWTFIVGNSTEPVGPCTEPGDCTLDCSENYDITEDIDIGSNRLTLNGVGDFIVNAVIKLGSLAKQIGCRIINAPNDGNAIIKEE